MSTEKIDSEIKNHIDSLRTIYGWPDTQLDLIKVMMEGIYLQGTIDGYKDGMNATEKIMEGVTNGK